MLVQFSVANYLSFKDRQTLSLVASRDTEHEENTFAGRGKRPLRLLKSVALYGANASGKSNLMKALRFVQAFVRESASRQAGEKTGAVPFKLDAQTTSLPSEFEVVFIHEDEQYVYGFTVDAQKVHEEWLTAARLSGHVARPRLLFRRSASEGYEFGGTWRGGREKLAEVTSEKALFLSVAAQFNSPVAGPLVEWFERELRGIGDEPELGSEMRFTTGLVTGEEGLGETARQGLLSFLQAADPSVEDVSVDMVPLEKAPRFAALSRSSQAEILSGVPEGGSPELPEVRTVHRRNDGGEVRLELEAEGSAGCRRLFALFGPWFYMLSMGCVLCVDEIERKLHPLITRYLVTVAHHSESAQLVFTTHDSGLLDSQLFRRDQIWFTEKDSSGATQLYSLWDYKVRKDENYRSGYLKGRYGAIPFVGEFGF